MVRAATSLFCLVAFVSFAAPIKISRYTVLIVLPTLLIGGLLGRHALRRSLYRRRTRGLDVETTVVIGDVQSIGRLIREIRRAPAQGMDIVAACVSGLDTSGDGLSAVEGVPVFGYPAQAMSTVDLFNAEVVAVSNHLDLEDNALRRLSWALEERGVDLVVAPGIVEVAGPRLSIRPVAGVSAAPRRAARDVGRPAADQGAWSTARCPSSSSSVPPRCSPRSRSLSGWTPRGRPSSARPGSGHAARSSRCSSSARCAWMPRPAWASCAVPRTPGTSCSSR